MLIVKLQGGLGNQLFQYAFGRKIAISRKEKLIFDCSHFTNDYLNRKLLLSALVPGITILTNEFLKKIIQPNTKLNRLMKALNLFNYKSDSTFLFDEEPEKPIRLVSYYDGYWQSYRYFESIREILLKEIFLDKNKLGKRHFDNIPKDSISVHVRRKDYLTNSRYGFLGIAYYQRAIELMHRELMNPYFFVFSDDINWCRDNLSFNNNVSYISGGEFQDYEELMIIAKTSHQIIANSSFSWWGAWLNPNPNKIVIRPSRPFVDRSLEYQYYYPENWRIIENSHE